MISSNTHAITTKSLTGDGPARWYRPGGVLPVAHCVQGPFNCIARNVPVPAVMACVMLYGVARVAPAVIAKIVRALVISALGATLGALAVLLSYDLSPALVLEMDRPVSAAVNGLYGEERVERETFAWTGKVATLTLQGLDRHAAWSCVIRLRGARADVSTLPEVILAIDGVVGTRHQTSNDFADVRLDLPPADRPGAIVTLAVSNTFVPPGDPRTLGVIVDRWTCAPVNAGWVWAPRRAVGAAAVAGAVFGLAMVVVGASTWATIGLLAAMAALMAIPLSWDLGPFGAYPRVAWRLALGLAVALAASAAGTRWRLGRPLSGPARFVLCFTAIALVLKLLALMHPSKLIIDAVFHAHRVQWILDGRWFFTQPMPSGVRFPYAIGLYVFAAPWTLITGDFVTLLRLIVTISEAAGGLLLYALIRRFWDDRPAGAVAAVLFMLVPRTFEIVGNANMTNAFGQSAAFAVLGAATVWTLRWRQWTSWTGFMLLTAGALLCHISTFTLLGAILLSLVVAYRLIGGRDLRSPALSILTAMGVAAMLAVAVYYGHFGAAYRSAARVQAAVDAGAAAALPAPLTTKVADAARLTVAAVGWPMLLLATPGAFLLWRARRRDRFTLALVALAATFVVFSMSVILAPVDQSFQRYAAEFFSRVTLATYPVVVTCAAVGSLAAWRAGGLWRMLGAVAMAGTVVVGVREWVQWLR